MWKFSMFLEWFAFYVLLLLALTPAVNSNETPTPRTCAVCLGKDCANGVRIIYLESSDTPVWVKANCPTGIQQCSMENLKADAPCKMANGSLVLPADNPLQFEGMDTRDVRCKFNSQISPCADLLNSTPSPGMCAVCLEKDCATGVTRIYPAGSDIAIWPKANSSTEIQNCCMENLKADAPCKMANDSFVKPADNPLQFEGIDTSGVRRVFDSQISPCADLNLPPSSTPSPGSGSGSGSRIIGGIIGGIGIGILILILIGVLIWKRKSCGQGQDKDHRHGNNGVPPHDAEHRDENTMEKQPLKGGVPNGNVNGVHREDDSVGPEDN